MKITPQFWNFIEDNVPGCQTREDVLLQSELQLFIDGHESSVKDMTIEEAIEERDKILFQLCTEAINAFTSNLPVEITGCDSLLKYAGVIAETAYMAGVQEFRPSHDSREIFSQIIQWSNEFCCISKDANWNEKDYCDVLYASVKTSCLKRQA